MEDDYQFCPKCRTELVKKCFHCKKNINMAWKNCPFCGKENKKK
ncbi:MAG: zinc ribbon domain-containing protein [Candidatus Peribacteria bacterium]|nr:MAG: zinc ribbon domain-containing protein [Candidatus Peribacteria bacterium]